MGKTYLHPIGFTKTISTMATQNNVAVFENIFALNETLQYICNQIYLNFSFMGDLVFDEESRKIIHAAIEVHKALGRWFKEEIYQDALQIQFRIEGIPAQREFELPVYYQGQKLAHGYRADFLCYGNILVELKAKGAILDAHRSQVAHYLKATGLKEALILNFGEERLVPARVVF